MNEPISFPVIAGTLWQPKTTWYVRDVPHRGSASRRDWEYTDKRAYAIPLSRYWWRRFRADSEYCGRSAQCWEV